MHVPGCFYVNDRLKQLIFDELASSYSRGGAGGFLPAVKQMANVAALPGIVGVRFQCHAAQLQDTMHYFFPNREGQQMICVNCSPEFAEVNSAAGRAQRIRLCHWQCRSL